MKYSLNEAQKISQECLQASEHIQSLQISQYQKDLKTAYLLTQMESLGIPLMMDRANEWSKSSEGNALLLQTYQFIGNTREL